MPNFIVNVSSLKIQNKPSNPDSKIYLKRNTAIKTIGPPVKYKEERWEHVVTVNEPVISGYLPRKYLTKL